MDHLYTLIKTIENSLQERYKNQTSRQQIAWWLLSHVTKKTKSELLADPTMELSNEQQVLLQKVLYEHMDQHKPLQYILGTVPFWELEFYVEPPILIPRPETEEWVINLINLLLKLENKSLTILDIGSGTGCIGISLAYALPEATVYASDISPQALALSAKNAHHNKVKNIQFLQSKTFASIPKNQQFDLIVSNPPYISKQEWETLDPVITQWEDKQALLANDEGLEIIREIIQESPRYLKKNNELKQRALPQLVLEFGYKQGPRVQALAQAAGFSHAELHKDFSGNFRILYAEL